jgi:hypothetical protein
VGWWFAMEDRILPAEISRIWATMLQASICFCPPSGASKGVLLARPSEGPHGSGPAGKESLSFRRPNPSTVSGSGLARAEC